jgi:hypothetical protein
LRSQKKRRRLSRALTTPLPTNPQHRALDLDQVAVVAQQMDDRFAAPATPPAATAATNLVQKAQVEAIDQRIATTTDSAERTRLEKQKVAIETKQTAQANVAEVKKQAQNLTANNAPETAKALVQSVSGQVADTAVSLQEHLDEITPAGVFAEEEGAPPPAAQPAEPVAAAPPAVPPATAQAQAQGVQPALPGIAPTAQPGVQFVAEAVQEEQVVRPGIKGQEVVLARPSQQIAQQLAGVKVEVPTISETGEAGVAPNQDAASALADIKNDLTGFQILINCLS